MGALGEGAPAAAGAVFGHVPAEVAGAAAGMDVFLEMAAVGQRPDGSVHLEGGGMPFGPAGGGAGVGQDLFRAAGDIHVMLHARHGALLFQRFPVQAALEPVHEREDQVEVMGLHQVAAVVQFVQSAHVADPRQARDRVVGGQVLAGVEDLVAQVARQQRSREECCDIGVELGQQPPGGEQGGAEEDDQPGGEEDHAPVPGRFPGHLPGDEETVVVPRVALVEHLPQAGLVVAEVLVDRVFAPVEEHQRRRHHQPLPGPHVLEAAKVEGEPGCAIGQDEATMQPDVVEGVDPCAIAVAKGLGVVAHGCSGSLVDISRSLVMNALFR
ncbi:hypothetical protein D3C85_925460 [compost metagenome]